MEKEEETVVELNKNEKQNAPKTPVVEKKLKILCLHGYAQNLKIFQKRTAVLKKALKSVAELYYVAGPHVSSMNPADHQKLVIDENTPEDEKPLGWWNFSDDDKKYFGLEESLELLLKIMKEEGPFDGVFGFSQGSSMAAILCSHLELENEKGNQEVPPTPKFVMFFSGFRPDDDAYNKYFNSERKLKIKSLHVYGEEDKWLNPERSKKLATFYENPTILTHSGGHFIPMEAEKRHYYVDYIKQFLDTN
ncbi:FSH1-domain-containing protein [Piromyces finnis]|uniref:FSH1-domain-containing protein n=1 Tax=Piromyces finnis TaxID=1754191 RepID=A0A1Y1VAP9_9FUNG|nr:FSH1-domain-containing protein [Piromyces finnis]|eukprot:ORX49990.1 FSH1-domain-containing protein [Piromyces finnis]